MRASKILDSRGNPISRVGAPSPRGKVRGRYDAAVTDADNYKHWAMSDALSARSANSPEIRRILRDRARYEVANNSYAAGIIQTRANDTIGTGPGLQMTTEDEELNREIEEDFSEWACAVCLSDKLQTMVRARDTDGEAFTLLDTADDLPTDVKLYPKLIECDQVATPGQYRPDPFSVDGLRFDRLGRPVEYHVLRAHPGDAMQHTYGFEFDLVPAELMLHWFRRQRPHQFRGVPEITPALGLFAQLRRFTLAVLAAAETAADFAAIVYSELPPDGNADVAEAFETLEIEKRMMTTLPSGWKMSQFKAEQPATTYDMFKHEILNEIARCLSMPYNVAAGNSSSYNYASGRMDHQVYYRNIGVDQGSIEETVLDPILMAWLQESAMVSGARRGSIRPGDWPHRWLWPGMEHVDPMKEANATKTRLETYTTTFTDECHKQGIDPETQVQTIAKDVAMFKALGLRSPYEQAPATATNQAPPPADDSGDNPDGNPDDEQPAGGGQNANGNHRTYKALLHRSGHD